MVNVKSESIEVTETCIKEEPKTEEISTSNQIDTIEDNDKLNMDANTKKIFEDEIQDEDINTPLEEENVFSNRKSLLSGFNFTSYMNITTDLFLKKLNPSKNGPWHKNIDYEEEIKTKDEMRYWDTEDDPLKQQQLSSNSFSNR